MDPGFTVQQPAGNNLVGETVTFAGTDHVYYWRHNENSNVIEQRQYTSEQAKAAASTLNKYRAIKHQIEQATYLPPAPQLSAAAPIAGFFPINGSTCLAWVQNPVPDMVVSWGGGCTNGKASGEDMLLVGTKAGGLKGAYSYTGTIIDGKPSGQGMVMWPNGDSYLGQFVNGAINGKGMLSDMAGNSYDGQFKNGKKHGQGKEFYAPDYFHRYGGTFANGKRVGKGLYFTTGIEVYIQTYDDNGELKSQKLNRKETKMRRYQQQALAAQEEYRRKLAAGEIQLEKPKPKSSSFGSGDLLGLAASGMAIAGADMGNMNDVAAVTTMVDQATGCNSVLSDVMQAANMVQSIDNMSTGQVVGGLVAQGAQGTALGDIAQGYNDVTNAMNMVQSIDNMSTGQQALALGAVLADNDNSSVSVPSTNPVRNGASSNSNLQPLKGASGSVPAEVRERHRMLSIDPFRNVPGARPNLLGQYATTCEIHPNVEIQIYCAAANGAYSSYLDFVPQVPVEYLKDAYQVHVDLANVALELLRKAEAPTPTPNAPNAVQQKSPTGTYSWDRPGFPNASQLKADIDSSGKAASRAYATIGAIADAPKGGKANGLGTLAQSCAQHPDPAIAEACKQANVEYGIYVVMVQEMGLETMGWMHGDHLKTAQKALGLIEAYNTRSSNNQPQSAQPSVPTAPKAPAPQQGNQGTPSAVAAPAAPPPANTGSANIPGLQPDLLAPYAQICQTHPEPLVKAACDQANVNYEGYVEIVKMSGPEAGAGIYDLYKQLAEYAIGVIRENGGIPDVSGNGGGVSSSSSQFDATIKPINEVDTSPANNANAGLPKPDLLVNYYERCRNHADAMVVANCDAAKMLYDQYYRSAQTPGSAAADALYKMYLEMADPALAALDASKPRSSGNQGLGKELAFAETDRLMHNPDKYRPTEYAPYVPPPAKPQPRTGSGSGASSGGSSGNSGSGNSGTQSGKIVGKIPIPNAPPVFDNIAEPAPPPPTRDDNQLAKGCLGGTFYKGEYFPDNPERGTSW